MEKMIWFFSVFFCSITMFLNLQQRLFRFFHQYAREQARKARRRERIKDELGICRVCQQEFRHYGVCVEYTGVPRTVCYNHFGEYYSPCCDSLDHCAYDCPR